MGTAPHRMDASVTTTSTTASTGMTPRYWRSMLFTRTHSGCSLWRAGLVKQSTNELNVLSGARPKVDDVVLFDAEDTTGARSLRGRDTRQGENVLPAGQPVVAEVSEENDVGIRLRQDFR